MQVDRDSPVPLYRQVADHLRARIAEEKLRRIPSWRTIQETYGVSRPTAEDAVKILVDEDLVYVVNGKGTFVRGAEGSPAEAGHEDADED